MTFKQRVVTHGDAEFGANGDKYQALDFARLMARPRLVRRGELFALALREVADRPGGRSGTG